MCSGRQHLFSFAFRFVHHFTEVLVSIGLQKSCAMLLGGSINFGIQTSGSAYANLFGIQAMSKQSQMLDQRDNHSKSGLAILVSCFQCQHA